MRRGRQQILGLALFLGGCSALVAGCEGSANSADKTPSSSTAPASAVASTLPKGLTLDEAMRSNIKVETLQETVVPRLLTATGKVQFNEDQMGRILAPVSGQIQGLRARVGDFVRKGDALFVIHSRDIAAALDEHVESHKDLDLAAKTYALNQDLFAHQAASRMAVQQAENEWAKAKTRVARTEATLRAFGIDEKNSEKLDDVKAQVTVRAPLAGTIIERSVTDGQFVQPDSNALMTIADLSSVWVLADIFERDLHLVSTKQKAEVTTAAYPDQRFVAHVARINDVVDPSSRTVKVRFLVTNADGRLKPEMFAQVTLFLQESEQILQVPSTTVFTEGGTSFAYVQTNEGRFIRRPVAVEPHGDMLRVLDGLQAGEQVVIDGALLVRLEETR